MLEGVRGFATATGKPGRVRQDYQLAGARAFATAAGKPGLLIVGNPGEPVFTVRTRAGIHPSKTYALTGRGNTISGMSNGRTRSPCG